VWACSENGRGEITERSCSLGRRKRGRPKLTWAEGTRGLMGEKGLMEEDWNDKRQLEEEDNIIVKWAQEDVETFTAC